MKYFEIDKYEKGILNEFEKGKLKRAKNVPQEKKELRKAAGFTLSKTRNINIRISEKDLQRIKSRAAEKGMPYQTLVTSVLHQYSNDRIKETV